MAKDPPPLVPGQVRVEVVTSDLLDDVLTTTVRVIEGQLPGPPLAPAGLYRVAPWREVLSFHRLVRASRDEATFETLDATRKAPAGQYILQPWWTPRQLALVTDMSTVWTPGRYEEGSGNDPFCALTWQNFGTGDDVLTDGLGSSISPEAHHRFIEQERAKAPPPTLRFVGWLSRRGLELPGADLARRRLPAVSSGASEGECRGEKPPIRYGIRYRGLAADGFARRVRGCGANPDAVDRFPEGLVRAARHDPSRVDWHHQRQRGDA